MTDDEADALAESALAAVRLWIETRRRVDTLANELTDLGAAVLVRWDEPGGTVRVVVWDGIGDPPPEIAAFPMIEVEPESP